MTPLADSFAQPFFHMRPHGAVKIGALPKVAGKQQYSSNPHGGKVPPQALDDRRTRMAQNHFHRSAGLPSSPLAYNDRGTGFVYLRNGPNTLWTADDPDAHRITRCCPEHAANMAVPRIPRRQIVHVPNIVKQDEIHVIRG